MSDERWRMTSMKKFRKIKGFERYSVSSDGTVITVSDESMREVV